MIQKVCVTSLALLVLFSSTMTFSQQKDRNRKSDAAQKTRPPRPNLQRKTIKTKTKKTKATRSSEA